MLSLRPAVGAARSLQTAAAEWSIPAVGIKRYRARGTRAERNIRSQPTPVNINAPDLEKKQHLIRTIVNNRPSAPSQTGVTSILTMGTMSNHAARNNNNNIVIERVRLNPAKSCH